MTGDGIAGGAGRTASGMSMMVGNAGKTVKSTVTSLEPEHHRPRRGARLRVHHALHRRPGPQGGPAGGGARCPVAHDQRCRPGSPQRVPGPCPAEPGGAASHWPRIAALLRATTATLDLDSTGIVPSDSELRIKIGQIQAAQAAQQGAQGPQGPQGPTASAQLENGAPVTDNFGA